MTLTNKHVDQYGWMTHEAESYVHNALIGMPDHGEVRINVGPVGLPSDRMIRLLACVLGPNVDLVIEGSAHQVAKWLEALQPLVTREKRRRAA